MENKKLQLEAEIGRLFLEIEKAKAFQEQAKQKIHELLVELAGAKD
jgi:hypothetical protein